MTNQATRRRRHRRPAAALLVILSAPTLGCQSVGPRAASRPTVAAVQGDNQHAIAVASEFVTGCDLSCRDQPPVPPCTCRIATLHAPDSWKPVQLHLDDQSLDYGPYYRDVTSTDGDGIRSEE